MQLLPGSSPEARRISAHLISAHLISAFLIPARLIPARLIPARLTLACLLWAALLSPPASGWLQADEIRFNRDIRPILSDKCFACHGPDKNQRKADLRLDTEDGLLGDSAPVVPGKPEASELMARITTGDDELRMPPPEIGKPLAPEEIQLLKQWIQQGAAWEGHWSLQPVGRPQPPMVEGRERIENPIDAFILRRLQQEGMEMSPPADRRTLIRRLSLDLTGLPPAAEEVEQFVADTREDAYERLVDRLLQSPHYGERMAVWWLDLVRYADSVGYHGDQPVSVFPFRDYVIEAFNANKPFDQFTLEQLAGDLLPDPTLEQKIASGYNRLGMMSAEGGVQPKEYLAKYIAERVRNLGGAWLGMTTGCCECHDHKYDPLSMRDFYSLEAFFADIQERGLYSGAHATGAWGPSVQVPTPRQQEQLQQLDRQLADLRRQLDTPTDQLAAAQRDWEASQVPWTQLTFDQLASAEGAELKVQEDGSVLAGGKNPATDTYALTVASPPAGLTALRLEVLPHDSLPKKGPGRAGNGNFVLTEFLLHFTPAGSDQETTLAVATAEASYEQTGAAEQNPYGKWTVAAAIDNDAKGPGFGWAVMERVGQPQTAIFQLKQPLAGGEGSRLRIELRQNHPNHALGRFRLAATTSQPPIKLTETPPPAIAAILAVPAEQRNAQQQQQLAAHYRTIAPALEPVRKELQQREAERKAVNDSIATTLITVAVPPRTIRMLPRGNWMDDSGEIVEPAFPETLPGLEIQDSRRLNRADLARWLTSPDNPLTSRVFVNRVWKLFFGAGLSRKLDDLGAQGEWPSHPELLDWLAGQFVDSGWNVKHVVKLVVMSEAYRQSSELDPLKVERDPGNRWLARQSRWRLDAELVRDNALAVSGLLVDRIGGASVKPYQPPGYWAYLNFPTRTWQNGQGEQLYRRGLYTHWQRQYLHPSLMAFDAPSREECAADRPRSNTPLQSLVLMNDATYVEAARALAERILREGGQTTDERLQWLARHALSRPWQPAELQVLSELLEKHRGEYADDEAAARQLMSVGQRPAPDDLPLGELAAWTSVSRAILMLHETITRS